MVYFLSGFQGDKRGHLSNGAFLMRQARRDDFFDFANAQIVGVVFVVSHCGSFCIIDHRGFCRLSR